MWDEEFPCWEGAEATLCTWTATYITRLSLFVWQFSHIINNIGQFLQFFLMKWVVNNLKSSFLIDVKFTATDKNKAAAAIIREEAILQNLAENVYSLKQN